MTRTERLRAKLFQMDDRAVFLERMHILKECDARFADETAGIRFGHTLGEMLSRISIEIEDDDLIVGRVPEVVPTDEQDEWFEANRDRYLRVPWFWTTGHLTISWARLLREGLCGISARAQRHLDRLDRANATYESRADFLQGAILCCEAIEGFAERYARTADVLSRSEQCTLRRSRELREIAEVCRRVPAQPARTFHEAVQSVWLVDMVLHAVVGARDFSLGRLDQYLFPYYERDLAQGWVTPEAAQELIECLFIKCSEIIGYADQANARKRSLCQDSVQYAVLGGQTPDGRDATNVLSTICLRAGYLKLKQPTIKVRYFDGIDEDFWCEACKLVRAGGSVGIYNDDVVIPAFASVGVDIEDARDYVHYGCCNANVPGKEGSLMERWHSVPKYLELALHDGVDPLTGEQVGPRTGTIDLLGSLDDLLDALRLQMRHALTEERAKYPPLTEQMLATCSFTIESIFLEDCIENAREWRLAGAKYWHKSQHASGIATVADSLAAIDKIVYEDQELTLEGLRDAVDQDFCGHEALRQRLLNRCPKYGNDDDAVDEIAAQVAEIFCDEVVRCNEVPHSIRFWPEIYSYHNNRRMGRDLGATPDGRRRGESISENQSPTYGMDRRGVTASLRSIAKLPLNRTPGGGTNLKIHPSAVQGEEGLEALSDLLKTYFREGGQHLQLNILDSAELRQAQRHPEEYKTLSVRVVGYSAYFTALSREVQDDIIRRTEHIV